MKPKSIAMFNLVETRRDPRVRRMANALALAGHRVQVFGVLAESNVRQEAYDNYEIIRIPWAQTYRRRDMEGMEAAVPVVGAILRRCQRDVMELADTTNLEIQARRVRGVTRRIVNTLRRVDPNAKGPPPRTARDEVQRVRAIVLTNFLLYRAALDTRPDVIHCNDLDTLLAGLMLKETLHIPLIYDAHELYADQLASEERSPFWYQFYSRLERELLPYTDGRMTVCDSLGRYFEQHYGSRPFVTVHNVPSLRLLPDPEVLRRRSRPRKILYHGAYTSHRGLEQVVAAAQFVPQAAFVLRGYGSIECQLRDLARQYGVEDRVTFAPAVEVDDLITTAAESDIGLNPFSPVCQNTRFALPNKFFEYMMAGLAIGSTALPEMGALTQQLDVGILFDDNRPETLAEGLLKLLGDECRLDEYRRNSYEAARTHFHWERVRAEMLAYYEDVLCGNGHHYQSIL